METTLTVKSRKPITKGRVLSHLFIWVLIFFTVFPIYIVIESSLNTTGLLSTNSFLPHGISLANFKLLFHDPAVPFSRWMLNSFLLAILNSIISDSKPVDKFIKHQKYVLADNQTIKKTAF